MGVRLVYCPLRTKQTFLIYHLSIFQYLTAFICPSVPVLPWPLKLSILRSPSWICSEAFCRYIYKMTISAYCLKLVCFIRRCNVSYNIWIGNTFTQFFLKIICNSLIINWIFFKVFFGLCTKNDSFLNNLLCMHSFFLYFLFRFVFLLGVIKQYLRVNKLNFVLFIWGSNHKEQRRGGSETI